MWGEMGVMEPDYPPRPLGVGVSFKNLMAATLHPVSRGPPS
jgi:hypothetical protein